MSYSINWCWPALTVPSNWRSHDWLTSASSNTLFLKHEGLLEQRRLSRERWERRPNMTSRQFLLQCQVDCIYMLLMWSLSYFPVNISTSSSCNENKRRCSKSWWLWFLSIFLNFFITFWGSEEKKSSMLSVKAPSPCPGLCCPFLTPLSLNKFSPFLYTATFPGETLTESGAKLQGRHGAQFGQWLNSDVITKEPCKPRAGKRGVD